MSAHPATGGDLAPGDGPIDMTVLDEYRDLGTDGAGDFLTSLIDAYLVESVASVDQVADAVARSDAVALKKIAHCLKGSSGLLGARTLAAICQELETLASSESGDRISAVAATLGEEFARVRAVLQSLRRAGT